MEKVTILSNNGDVLETIYHESFVADVRTNDILCKCMVRDQIVGMFWLKDKVLKFEDEEL
jgi:hypothetical protein